MITHFHGVDKHSTHLTITTLNQQGEIIRRYARCENFDDFIESLSEHDAVAIEAGNMTFHLADAMEAQGASVYIINPRLFKIIAQSTKKTDKNDSLALAISLRNYLQDVAMSALPLVYKPSNQIRKLRRMFSGHETLKNAVIKLRNAIIGMIRDMGIRMSDKTKNALFNYRKGLVTLEQLDLDDYSKVIIRSMLVSLHTMMIQKENLKTEIIRYGAFLQDDVRILISIKGVSTFLALGFLADVGDLSRFHSIRNLNAYLGLVPMTRASGKHEFQGHIIRASRHLTRTLFTQAVHHIGNSSPSIAEWYASVRERRGIGRGRIALVRKTVKIMRRMLLDRELYRWVEQDSYNQKLVIYNRILRKNEQGKPKVA